MPNQDRIFPALLFPSSFFSFLALYFVQLSWQAQLILTNTQITYLTYVSLPLLRCRHRTRWLARYMAASLMMWSLYGILSSFLKHLITVRCQCLGFAGVQDYRDNQGAHESDL